LDENVKIAVPWLELLSSMAGHDWALILPLPTGEASMRPPNIKGRSVTIAGHKTSVSIENAFWKSLREIAEGRGETLYGLIGDIDAERKFANLSSVIRLFVLGFYRDRVDHRGGAVFSLGLAPANSIEHSAQ
jgi:predicted DNA-binding ribbon-helix-helix protein